MSRAGLLLFDLDGTLLDSREFLVSESYRILEKLYPGNYDYRQIADQFGNGFARLLPDTTSPLNRAALAEFHAAKAERYCRTSLFPGVAEGLRTLKESGFAIGIVTNQNKQLAEAVLRETGVWPLIDLLIGREDVREGKPSPEGILKAMQAAGCAPRETAMFGDSRYDIRAARNAGVRAVFLKWYDDLEVPEHPDRPDDLYLSFEPLVRALAPRAET